jgi:hypothetical protein
MTRSWRHWIAYGLACALRDAADQSEGSEARSVGEVSEGSHEASADIIRSRLSAALGAAAPWHDKLALALATQQPPWQGLDEEALAQRMLALPEFAAGFDGGAVPRLRQLFLHAAPPPPLPAALQGLALPALGSVAEVAAWLGFDDERLHWLAGPGLREDVHRDSSQHYQRRLRPKAQGGWRLIEAPKSELKLVQRRLLDRLLALLPAHEAAHGFVRGRSALTHAAAHAGQGFVVHLDLRDFFPSVPVARVRALWRTLGAVPAVAGLLTALVTTRTPRALLEGGRLDATTCHRLHAPHLPQGAPSSPALANLCAFALDLRLAGLARAFGATYTRYADDLVFSGPDALRSRTASLLAWAGGIADDEGYTIHRGKTRCMPRHRRQRVAGAVVNVHPNLPRQDFDALKATLHQCVLHGPASQNRAALPDFRAHLRGRIAWAAQLNAVRAAKLQALYARIVWPD